MTWDGIAGWCAALVLRPGVLKQWLSHPVDRGNICHSIEVLFRMVACSDIHLCLAPGYIEVFGPGATELRIPRNRHVLGPDHERLLDLMDRYATHFFGENNFLPSGSARIHRRFRWDAALQAKVPRLAILRALCAHFLVNSEHRGILYVSLTIVKIAIRALVVTTPRSTTKTDPSPKIPRYLLWELYHSLATRRICKNITNRCAALYASSDLKMPSCEKCGLSVVNSYPEPGFLSGRAISDAAKQMPDDTSSASGWEIFIRAFAENTLNVKQLRVKLTPRQWHMLVQLVNHPLGDPDGDCAVMTYATTVSKLAILDSHGDNTHLGPWPLTTTAAWPGKCSLLSFSEPADRALFLPSGGWISNTPQHLWVDDDQWDSNSAIVLAHYVSTIKCRPHHAFYPIRQALWWMLRRGQCSSLTQILQTWAFPGPPARMPPRCLDPMNWTLLAQWLCGEHMSAIAEDDPAATGLAPDSVAWAIVCNFVNPAKDFYEYRAGTARIIGDDREKIADIDEWWSERLRESQDIDMVTGFYHVCGRNDGQRTPYTTPECHKLYPLNAPSALKRDISTLKDRAVRKKLLSRRNVQAREVSPPTTATGQKYGTFDGHPLWWAICIAERARWTWPKPDQNPEEVMEGVRSLPLPPTPRASWKPETLVLGVIDGNRVMWRDVVALGNTPMARTIPGVQTVPLVEGVYCRCNARGTGARGTDQRASRAHVTRFNRP